MILEKWKCTAHAGYQCYHEEEDGMETLHIALPNAVMSEWADKCVCPPFHADDSII